MIVKSFEFNMFGEQTYVVYDPETREAAVIDPGMMNARETGVLFKFISSEKLSVRHLIMTHLHVDHIMGATQVKNTFGVGLSANENDAFLGKRIAEQVQMFHLPLEVSNVGIEHNLKDGDRIMIGNSTLEVLAVPGHSPGSIALYSPEDGFVITGDALFRGSIGRTDLPGGDFPTLINSITSKLLSLPDSTIVFPGHGPSTTVGEEKQLNPYL